MSEEIKQLIDYLQKFVNDDKKEITKYGVEISQDSTKLLLNYIEQLQQENQRLKQWDKNKDSRNSRQRVVNAKLIKENEELKNKQNKFEKDYKEMIEIQGQDGNYNYDSYMLGLYNGMEYIISLYENREPIYKNGKDIKFLHEDNILTEFEKWLEEKVSNQVANNDIAEGVYLALQSCMVILQELKEGKK